MIGKRVFRTKNTCGCKICADVYENGLVIGDEMHADYLNEMEGCAQQEGHDVKYFETIEERNQYEKK